MKKIYFIFLFFLIWTNNSFSATLDEEGQSFSGTLKNLYGQGINITLPDGRWEVNSSEKDEWYTDIELYSSKYDAWAYVYTPVAPMSGDFWRQKPLSKCSGKKVLISLVERSTPEATLCVEEQEIDGDKWIVINLEARSERPPLKWLQVMYYLPNENLNRSLSSDQLKKIGKNVFNSLRKGFRGGASSDMSQIAELMLRSGTSNFEFQEESTSQSSGSDDILKSKLSELKDLLENGLITQEQYDSKSSEILENF